ncbi:MAG: hypothetical protein KDD92_19830 [Caldilineaceae bacterium]|nr:hypothetical protein [Caldilineaceae bacterium]
MSSYDFWANHSFLDSSQVSEKAAVDYLLKGSRNPYPQDVPDISARIALSALSLLGDKEYARTGTRREAGGLSHLYKQQSFQDYLHERFIRYHDLLEASPDLSNLPAGSFTLSFTFTLDKPYISKDDTALHLLDNPVKKDWVFKLPYVASTQWKGALRATMVRQLVDWWQSLEQAQQSQRTQQKQFVIWRVQLTRLFGTETENLQYYLERCGGEKLGQWYKRYVRRFLSQSSFLAGRLYFYPSFFHRLSLEVINPHDRETGAGSLPIYFESVPIGATAPFTLLYTPLDRVGRDGAETRRQVTADLQLIAGGLQAMLTVYGFGAKTSSGFGVADDAIEAGVLVVKLPDVTFPQIEGPPIQKPDDEYLKYLDETGQIKSGFEGNGEGGLMSNREYKDGGEQLGGGSLSEFKAFRKWYDEHGKEWQESFKTGTSAAIHPTLSFERLGQLSEILHQMGDGA